MLNFKKDLSKKVHEIQLMSEAGKIVAEIHEELKKMIKPGVSGIDLDNKSKEIIEKNNAIPAFYKEKFPNTICFSKNEVLIHGIPTKEPLKEGDIVSIDVAVEKNNYYADAAFTIGVGEISEEKKHLLKVTNEALRRAIEYVKPGIKLSQLGKFIQDYVESENLEVNKDFVGHGIGKSMHEFPNVPNFYDKYNNFILQENMVICIEPMVQIGTDKVYISLENGWDVISKNNKPSAHQEHMVLVTKNGGIILTKK